MFNDKVTNYLQQKAKQQKPLPPLLRKDPVNLEVVDLRRKAASFKDRGNVLMETAAIQTSHKRSAQLKREAQVAFDMAEEYREKAEFIAEESLTDGMKKPISHEVKTKDGVDLEDISDLDLTEPVEFEEILEHYGRKGMRWGQRIFSKKKGSSKSEKKAAKKAKGMTDEELGAAIKRLKMEKEYASLSSSKKSNGESIVKSVLRSSIKSAANKHATKLIFDAMTKAIQKKNPDYKPKWK